MEGSVEFREYFSKEIFIPYAYNKNAFLEQFFLLKIVNANDYDKYAENKNAQIPVSPIELRHILEIHSIPAGQQSQRQKNRGDHRKNRHGLIELEILFGLKVFSNLMQIFSQSAYIGCISGNSRI